MVEQGSKRAVVISPYYREPTSKLLRCHRSVQRQSVPVDHMMVADGYPNRNVDKWVVQHIPLPVRSADSGDTPRLMGMLAADAQGYDYVMLLDGDNWYEPNHAAEMIATQERTGAAIVTCPRSLRRLDGSFLAPVCTESDGVQFNDFNCYLFTRASMESLRPLFFRDRSKAYFTDRFLWWHIKQAQIPIARSAQVTVNYESTIVDHYLTAGETPPPEAKAMLLGDDGVMRKYSAEAYMEGLRQNKVHKYVEKGE